MKQTAFALLALVLGAAVDPARADALASWSGPVRTGTIVVGEESLFSYELRESDPLKSPLFRELIVCRPKGELIRILVTRRKAEYMLELGYHSRTKPIEPEIFVGPVPTKSAEVPRDSRDPKRFVVPMSKLRAGTEELEFAVTDVLIPTVQRWLDDTWRGTSPDLRQALSDVLVASRFVPFGMGEDLTPLLGVVPMTELRAYAQEGKFRREERSPDFCAGP